jgi:hypothetical protein
VPAHAMPPDSRSSASPTAAPAEPACAATPFAGARFPRRARRIRHRQHHDAAGAGEHMVTVFLIDWDDLANNDFAFAEEVTVKGALEHGLT